MCTYFEISSIKFRGMVKDLIFCLFLIKQNVDNLVESGGSGGLIYLIIVNSYRFIR